MIRLIPAERLLRNRPRRKTTNPRRVSKKELLRSAYIANLMLEGISAKRPATRGDCLQGPNAQRPCPWVSCVHHLAVGVSEKTGSLHLPFGDDHLEVMHETCALDVADRGGMTLVEIGVMMNITRERVRQIEVAALQKVRAEFDRLGIAAGDFTRAFGHPEAASASMQTGRDHEAHVVKAIRTGRVKSIEPLTPGDLRIHTDRGYRYVISRVQKKLDKYKNLLVTRKAQLAGKIAAGVSRSRLAITRRSVKTLTGRVEALQLRLDALRIK